MEQECYAFICALDKWHNYLTGIHFIWQTDHQALTQLDKKAQINERCERWRLKILTYDFTVQYIPGLQNAMPDYLSRSPVDDPTDDPDEWNNTNSKETQAEFEFFSIDSPTTVAVQTRAVKRREALTDTTSANNQTTPDTLPEEHRIIPITIEQLKDAQCKDDYAKHIVNNIKIYKQYIMKDDLLMRRFKPRVPYVPKGELCQTILKIYHDSVANGAHFRRNKTLHKIKTHYFWPSMYKEIDNYIKSSILCVQHNPRRQKSPGNLRPIQPPEGVWQLVSMDYHGPITPTSQRGNKYIITLTDILSKFVIAKAVRDNSAQTAVRFLKEDVITKFGTPRCILTDNGTHFTSSLMNELIK